MPAKRTLDTIDSVSSSSSKKIKLEEPCYFPLDVNPVIREIAKFLEGDHLSNFKRACKAFNENTKDMSNHIFITKENFQRTTSTPGFHFIKFNGTSELELKKYMETLEPQSCPEVKYLTIDHCRIEGTKEGSNYQFLLNGFDDIQELLIMRCRTPVVLKLREQAEFLHSIEVHSTKQIRVYLDQHLDQILLHSTESLSDTHANVVIQIPDGKPITNAFAVKTCAQKSLLVRRAPEHTGFMDPFEHFDTDSRFL